MAMGRPRAYGAAGFSSRAPTPYARLCIAMAQVRKTDNVVAIFNTMLERPRKSWYGLEIAKQAGIGGAPVSRALTRLGRAGLLTAKWEEVDPSGEGRPRGRLTKRTGGAAR